MRETKNVFVPTDDVRHVVRVGPRVPRLGSCPRLCRPVALVAEDDGSGGPGGDGVAARAVELVVAT
eukprot:3679121-Prymnesium_polylepis.1